MKYAKDGDKWIDYLNGLAITLVAGTNNYIFVGKIDAISLMFFFIAVIVYAVFIEVLKISI